jgi:hypothetical protein
MEQIVHGLAVRQNAKLVAAGLKVGLKLDNFRSNLGIRHKVSQQAQAVAGRMNSTPCGRGEGFVLGSRDTAGQKVCPVMLELPGVHFAYNIQQFGKQPSPLGILDQRISDVKQAGIVREMIENRAEVGMVPAQTPQFPATEGILEQAFNSQVVIFG